MLFVFIADDQGESTGPSVGHETSDEPLTEVSGCMEETLICSSQPQEEVVTLMEQDDTSLDQLRSTSSGASSDTVADQGRSSVEQTNDCHVFNSTAEESEDGAFIDLPVKDSLPLVSSSDDEEDEHSDAEHLKEVTIKAVVAAEKVLNENETTLNDTMEDLLGDNVGHFVQEDSSPEDFYQSEQVTEALELLRNIHDEDDAAAAKAALTSVSISQTISPPNLSNDIVPLEKNLACKPKPHVREITEHSNILSKIALQNNTNITTISKGQVKESSSSSIKADYLQASSSAQATTTQQQPPTTTTVTLTLPFPVTLPLNLPLTLPINLPPGTTMTTLVVSDPSALMGIRPANSQSPCSTAENGKTSSSISTSFAAIAPSKLRSSTPSPSRILPRSSNQQSLASSNANATSPSSFATSGIALASAQNSPARGNGANKQGQQPSKAPPGTVNLERSYRICQAVIENSPNCEQLKAQLRPPSAFSSSSPTSGGSSSSSSGTQVVIPASAPNLNGLIPIATTIQRQSGGNTKNSAKQGSSSLKSSKSSHQMKLTNEGGKALLSNSASSSAPNTIVLQAAASGSSGHLDTAKTGVPAVSLSPSTAQLQLQQPRQKLICIAPSTEALSKSQQPIVSAGSRQTGVVGQRSVQQLQRSVSAPVKPSTTVNQSQQQQKQPTSFHSYPKQAAVQIKPSISLAPSNNNNSIGVRAQANIHPFNHIQSNSVNPSSGQPQEQPQGLQQVKNTVRAYQSATNSVRPRATIAPQVQQLNNQVRFLDLSYPFLVKYHSFNLHIV